MVGSINPRCETVRGTHWPKAGRRCVWSSRRGKPSWPAVKTTASTGRTYGCKRSDQTRKKLLRHGGRPHMGPGLRRDDDRLLRRCQLLRREAAVEGLALGRHLDQELRRREARAVF